MPQTKFNSESPGPYTGRVFLKTTIRPAEAKDQDSVFGLARDFATSFAVEEEALHSSFSALIGDPNAYFAVAEVGKNVIGYVLAFSHITFYANGSVAWVEEIMVEASHRQQGVGKVLMHSVHAWAESWGCKLVALATRRAAPFYETLGYQASATYFRKLL